MGNAAPEKVLTMKNSQLQLPVWYRLWLILPLSVIILYILGMCLTLPPNRIDPRKYPAFMDGGSDWGGSNIFFYTRVVMLFMGLLGFLSLSQLRPRPDWQNLSYRSISMILLKTFRFHLACYVTYALLAVFPDGGGDQGTWLVQFVEIAGWYVLSACFAVSLLRLHCGRISFFISSALTVLFLIIGFYLGHWVTGAGFNAHLLGVGRLLSRALVEMAFYASCVVVTVGIMRKVRAHHFLAGL